MSSKFFRFFKPLISFIPEIKQPENELPFRTRLYCTLFVFLIYAILSCIPIIGKGKQSDPFSFMRLITLSSQGSLAEFGIASILTAGILMQILIGLRIIDINLENQEGRNFYNRVIKVLAILITIIFALMSLIGGIYGDVNVLGIDGQLTIIIQLVFTGIIFIYLDEMIQKGWGFGSGIALFLVCNIALYIFTALFSVQPILEGSADVDLAVTSNRGILIALFAWITEKGLIEAIQSLFFRYDPGNSINLPNFSIFSLVIAVIVFIFVIYIESIYIKIPISYNQKKNIEPIYPIKLLYLSVIPIILVYTFLANIDFIAKFVWSVSGRENSTSLIVNLLGMFEIDTVSNEMFPTSGLIYFLTPPRSIIGDYGVINPIDPLPSIIRAVIYSVIVVGLCVSFTIIWMHANKESTRKFVSNLLIYEIRDEMLEKEKMINALVENIQNITLIGGFILGLIAAFADCLAPFGAGGNIVLIASIISQYIEVIVLKRSEGTRLIRFYLVEE